MKESVPKQDYDMAIVGGGLGGSALAKVMAENGKRTLVLERETRFRDRVRGKGLVPWEGKRHISKGKTLPFHHALSRFWFVLGLALALACLNGQAAAQIRVGSITGVRGDAAIERGTHSIPAVLAMPIMLGDELQTSAKSEATILLVDGSELTLSDSSTIVIDRSTVGPTPADSVVNLFKGKLRSVVNPRGGNLPDFEVHTPNAVIGVRGTDFQTEYIAGRPCPGFPQCQRYTDVGVYKGIVEVRNPTSAKPASVRVSGGYETTVPCELPPANPGPLGMGALSAPAYH